MLNIKPSNIRIWIHERDIGKLTKALWEGHGMRLRTESSNNVRVKKFLESVPYLMVRCQPIKVIKLPPTKLRNFFTESHQGHPSGGHRQRRGAAEGEDITTSAAGRPVRARF